MNRFATEQNVLLYISPARRKQLGVESMQELRTSWLSMMYELQFDINDGYGFSQVAAR